MKYLVFLVFSALFGLLCVVAARRHRDAGLGLFGLVVAALAIAALLP